MNQEAAPPLPQPLKKYAAAFRNHQETTVWKLTIETFFSTPWHYPAHAQWSPPSKRRKPTKKRAGIGTNNWSGTDPCKREVKPDVAVR